MPKWGANVSFLPLVLNDYSKIVSLSCVPQEYRMTPTWIQHWSLPTAVNTTDIHTHMSSERTEALGHALGHDTRTLGKGSLIHRIVNLAQTGPTHWELTSVIPKSRAFLKSPPLL